MRELGWCLMPNLFQFVLQPHHDGDLSRWMQWLMTSHVRRYLRRHGSSGQVWQGRFKSFAIQDDGHLLTVLRYVEWNALRAGLVGRAEDWRYGSLFRGVNIIGPVVLNTTFQPRDAKWITRKNRPDERK